MSATIKPDPAGKPGRDFILDHGETRPYEAIVWLLVGRVSLAIILEADDSVTVRAYPHGQEMFYPRDVLYVSGLELPTTGEADQGE